MAGGKTRGWKRAALVAALAPALTLMLGASARADKSESEKRALAEDQFDRAESARTTLESTPEAKRTLEQYKQVVTAYRRVYQITAHEEDVPTAILMVGDLYRAMGKRFDPKFYQSAIDAYQFLLHDYPTSHYREEALFDVAQIERDGLKDRKLAQKSYESFLKLHPRSPHAQDAKEALKELASPQQAHTATADVPPTDAGPAREPREDANSKEAAREHVSVSSAANSEKHETASAAAPVPLASSTEISPGEQMEAPASGKASNLTQINTWATPDYTRLVISLDGPVKYQAARLGNPQRIYFDVSTTHLGRTALHGPFHIQGDLVKAVRIGQNKDDVVRIVLEVEKVKNYSVFLLRNPYRMVVDVYPEQSLTAKTVLPVKPSSASHGIPAAEVVAAPSAGSEAKAAHPVAPASPTPHSSSAAPDTTARERAVDAALASADKPVDPSAAHTIREATSSKEVSPSKIDKKSQAADVHKSTSPLSPVRTEPPVAAPPTLPAKQSAKIVRAAKLSPPPEPEPNLDGQRSLTRVLGLKIGRIVIDAGHGGHDTGTIGPGGLMEKDLCLEVALRLGNMIEKQLPGAEVVYTRNNDTFIPLEERTAIANHAKADLFISIHANSSGDRAARGVETYYLNFSSSPEAMEVAARENATAQGGVHNLQDMIQQIARNEKIEESKELAADIQGSLSKRMQRSNNAIRDRGVRKAPFVVLIGANMPSILSEISFISNPADEQMLKKPENRQHVAEGLFRGVEDYLQSINSLTFNQAKATPGMRPGSLAPSGNQR
jgi:N-acetylmuramoyl-L-alanine amidase